MSMRRALLSLATVPAVAGLLTSAVASVPTSAVALASPAPRVSVAAGVVSAPHEDSYYPAIGDPSVDALHYGLVLDWDDAARRLTGTTTLTFRAPRAEQQLTLDLESQLAVSSVTLDGVAVTSTHPGKDLVIDTGSVGTLAADSRHTLVIAYAGTPAPYAFPGDRGDISGLGWTTTSDGQVWTMQEPYGAFTWYPSHDQPSDKATYDVTVTNRADWHAASGGTLVSDTVAGGLRTSHFRLHEPTASYLTTIAIGPYRAYHATGPHGLPLTYWVRPVDDRLLPALRQTPTILRQLEARLGRWPFASAGAVVVPSDSAMETQTLVTMGRSIPHGRPWLADLAHEYAHAWYGDTVTPQDWRDLWMNESFTMFDQIRWEIDRGWRTERSWRRDLDRYDQVYRDQGGPPGAYKPSRFGDGSVYYCGARMLYALRDKLGERTFDRMLRAWPRQHRYETVTRAEWVRFVDRFTGRHLDAFVERWLTSRRSPTA